MGDVWREPRSTEGIPEEEERKLSERRKFLKKAGKVALTAPAVALLLSAEKAQAIDVAPNSGITDFIR
jgi:hypothetical protein